MGGGGGGGEEGGEESRHLEAMLIKVDDFCRLTVLQY